MNNITEELKKEIKKNENELNEFQGTFASYLKTIDRNEIISCSKSASIKKSLKMRIKDLFNKIINTISYE